MRISATTKSCHLMVCIKCRVKVKCLEQSHVTSLSTLNLTSSSQYKPIIPSPSHSISSRTTLMRLRWWATTRWTTWQWATWLTSTRSCSLSLRAARQITQAEEWVPCRTTAENRLQTSYSATNLPVRLTKMSLTKAPAEEPTGITILWSTSRCTRWLVLTNRASVRRSYSSQVRCLEPVKHRQQPRLVTSLHRTNKWPSLNLVCRLDSFNRSRSTWTSWSGLFCESNTR